MCNAMQPTNWLRSAGTHKAGSASPCRNCWPNTCCPKCSRIFPVATPSHAGCAVQRRSARPTAGQVDFAVRGAFPQSSELIGYPLWPYQRHLYASPAYLALAGTPAHRTAGRPLADPAYRTAHPQSLALCRDGQITSVRPRPRLRLASGTAVYHGALAVPVSRAWQPG